MRQDKSINHSRWECKYHVVFIPKYRKKTLFGHIRRELGEVFRRLAKQRESWIEEGHLMSDHMHIQTRCSTRTQCESWSSSAARWAPTRQIGERRPCALELRSRCSERHARGSDVSHVFVRRVLALQCRNPPLVRHPEVPPELLS